MALTPPVIAGLVIFKLPAVEMLAIALIAGIAAQLVSRLLWRGLIPKPETSPIIAAVAAATGLAVIACCEAMVATAMGRSGRMPFWWAVS